MSELVVFDSGEAMAAVLNTGLHRASAASSDASELDSSSSPAKASRLSKLYAFKHTLLPTFDKPIVIPSDTEVVMMGIPGIFSNYGGIKDFETTISGDGVYYYGAEFLHLLLNKHLTRALPDLADAITQKWQHPIDIQTQSGGVHQAINIEVKKPGTTRRLYSVVGPYGVSLDKDSRNAHTSLGPVVGIQTMRGFRILFDQEAIQAYGEHIRGVDSERARLVAAAIERPEHISFGADGDPVIDTETTRLANGTKMRFLPFEGGHSDGALLVGPVIHYLAKRDIHANIPEALAQAARLVDPDQHFEFHQQKTGKIVLDHFGSHGEGRVLRTARRVYAAPETVRNGRDHVFGKLHDFRLRHSPVPELGRTMAHAR